MFDRMRSFFKFTGSWLTLFIQLFVLTVHAQVPATSAGERWSGLMHWSRMLEDTLFSGIRFRNIGPTQMNGRVVDLEVNPADPTEFYLAYASGGLWHTTNNGLSFSPLFDREAVLSIGDIAVNWKNKQIWVGTGEANSSRSSYSGMGVYKSSDGGASWKDLGLPESHHIGKIILHPADSNTAWVAVLGHLYSPNPERGVYKTTNGGLTWKQTLSIDENTGAVEMDMDPAHPDVLYACMWYRTRRAWDFVPFGPTSGIYKSTDGGERWTHITGKGSGFPDAAGVGRCGVAIYRGNPSIVYAVVDNNNPLPDTARPAKKDSSRYALDDFKGIDREAFLNLDNALLDTFLKKKGFPEKYTAALIKDSVRSGSLPPGAVYDWLVADDGFQQRGIAGCEVYRSDDGGQHWYRTHEKDIKTFSSYGYYFGKISVSPVDDRKIVVSGIQLLLSGNGGKKFTVTDKRNTHGDWHGCWINPERDGHWIAVNDGGCNITYDNGLRWFKATSVPAAQFYHITTDNAVPYRVYGGLQDNGTWSGASVLPSDAEEEETEDSTKKTPEPDEFSWQPLNGGDGMQVQVDTRDNTTLYSGYQFGYYSRQSPGKEPFAIHPMHDLGKPKLRYNWQTPILLSRHNQDILYYGANRLFRSMRQGEDPEAVSADLTKGKRKGSIPYGTLTAISESPLRFGLLYAGTDDGLVQLSRDGGYTFTNISRGLPADLWVSRVVASRYREGRVYVTLNGYRYDHFLPYLFVSDDYGSHWQQLGLASLPAEPLNVVREDPFYEDILYVGSDNGVYVSLDRGNRFHTLGHALPRVAVHDLVIQERERELVLGTHGRGIYITGLRLLHEAYERKAKAKPVLTAPKDPAGKKRKRNL
jgi:photosystem II stability/assembly factor-like uncharacterized protein